MDTLTLCIKLDLITPTHRRHNFYFDQDFATFQIQAIMRVQTRPQTRPALHPFPEPHTSEDGAESCTGHETVLPYTETLDIGCHQNIYQIFKFKFIKLEFKKKLNLIVNSDQLQVSPFQQITFVTLTPALLQLCAVNV